MTKTLNADRYLTQRGPVWYYQRFVPSRFSHVDARRRIRYSLNTPSVEIARVRRDALVEADDNYWRSLAFEAVDNNGLTEATQRAEEERYKAATARAIFFGYIYKTVDRLAREENSEHILERLDVLKAHKGNKELPHIAEIDALLGGTPKPAKVKTTVSQAFQIYLAEIAFDDQYNKSPKQKHYWEKTKRTSINYFVGRMGDLFIEDITREQALEYRNWWMERMLVGPENKKPAKPNTANRHIGNIRNLYTAFFKHIGQEERTNPFRNMFFKGESRSSVKPFENEWVRHKILIPRLFDDLRIELKVMIYVLIETGARMSEICNLMPQDIILRDNVPYISIRPRQNRELKTSDSERDIPLVGCALEAMKLCPNGFEHYRDKGELVSANLMKAFRKRDLLPSSDHVIYSFRHAFEKRMLEAGLDTELRCTLMGHKINRPAYGDGGSMEYRRDELLKITHPFSPLLFS